MEGYVRLEKVGASPSGKTNIYEVLSHFDIYLGDIKWHTPWRRYVFFPETACLFDASCLKEIACFCDIVMKQYNERRRKKKND